MRIRKRKNTKPECGILAKYVSKKRVIAIHRTLPGGGAILE